MPEPQQEKHSTSPLRVACLISGIALLAFVLCHTVAGSIWTAWPFDAKLHWVAWVGPVLLPIHICIVSILRYRNIQRRKEMAAMPPEQRASHKRSMQKAEMERQMHKKVTIRGMSIGFWMRWISGVAIVLLLIAHIATSNTAVTAVLMVMIGIHAFYAMGCLLMDINADREKRSVLRVVCAVAALAILAFFLWARLHG